MLSVVRKNSLDQREVYRAQNYHAAETFLSIY